jgi:hypothetical protein
MVPESATIVTITTIYGNPVSKQRGLVCTEPHAPARKTRLYSTGITHTTFSFAMPAFPTRNMPKFYQIYSRSSLVPADKVEVRLFATVCEDRMG